MGKVKAKLVDTLLKCQLQGISVTFNDLLEKMKSRKSSLFYALQSMIKDGRVRGIIDQESLKYTRGRLIPVYEIKPFKERRTHPKELKPKTREAVRFYLDKKGKNYFLQRGVIRERAGKEYFRATSPPISCKSLRRVKGSR